MAMSWEVLQYPQREFGPPSGPEDFFDRATLVAVFDNLKQSSSQPVIPPDVYYYWQPYFVLQLTLGIHFDPDASGVFQGPATFDILEGSADFELRVPL